MTKRRLPLARAYTLLEPGPVVLLTTAGPPRPNVMTLSWHTMLEFEPPLIGCVVSNRNHTFGQLLALGECVLNIPTVELARQVVRVGNSSGRRVDKFRAAGLTPKPAEIVAAPIIEECWANLECRVADTRMVEAYGFFVLEALRAWVDPSVKEPRTLHHAGRGAFRVAGETIRLRSGKK
ncbi:MAG: flavin reductase family protein [Planctomycetes bacterium]|jgi:flavin reductase (DIM6/NTAB) family NADH-FMN oxidoreductase RutF|nr:flavin reductase family protein [Ideonella sp.]MCU0867859.1 flavin reductase family protein [Planctomycetota bacterium]